MGHHVHPFTFPPGKAVRQRPAPTTSWWADAPQTGFTREAVDRTQSVTSDTVRRQQESSASPQPERRR